eukprot:5339541-Pyramimonas_sp.AAC.1
MGPPRPPNTAFYGTKFGVMATPAHPHRRASGESLSNHDPSPCNLEGHGAARAPRSFTGKRRGSGGRNNGFMGRA